MNDDFLDLLAVFLEEGLRFLVVGAHAMAVHGVPRATGDLDVWIKADPDEARRAWSAVARFGAPLEDLGISEADFATPGRVIQIGQPPHRIDIMTKVSGLDFEESWNQRVVQKFGALSVPFLGRQDLIRNKKASARSKDLADLEILQRRRT